MYTLQKLGDSFNDSIKFHTDSTFDSSTFKDSALTSIDKFESIEINDIFYEQLIESKLTFADAITYDISLDTTEAEVQFHSLFGLLF